MKRILNKVPHIPIIIFRRLICKMRSLYYSLYIDEGNGRIIITDPFIRVKIIKNKSAKLIIKGDVSINSHLGGNTPIGFFLDSNSILQIDGDFSIGHGVRLSLNKGATLYFGGKDLESGSGITSDTLIMAFKRIIIGKDFLCAWGIFISDSDWHTIGNQNHQADVIIGNHVWIANNSSVLKGSVIGDNSIIAGQSKVINKEYPPNSLLAGLPAKVVKTDINWSRDL
jgi:acetyltransferase-like isoleucine patch superfamily enzyme